MIEELKTLLDMVAELPTMALWLLGGFFLFKLIVYLSTTGAIVYGLKLLFDTVITCWKTERPPRKFQQSVKLDDEVIDDVTKERFLTFLKRCKKTTGIYLHNTDLRWLEEAVRDKEIKDFQGKAVTPQNPSDH